MPWYAYVETYYDPPPAGWHGGAYTRLNKKPNHAQLAAWARGAIPWSQRNCRRAVENAGGTWEQRRWRQANPTASQNVPPAGTPEYRPGLQLFTEMVEAADGDDEDDLQVEDDETGEAVELV